MVASTAVMRPRNSKCVRPPDSPCVSGVGPFSGVGRLLFGVGLIYLMYLYVYIFHLYTHMNILAMVASTAVMRPRSSRCVRPPDSPCQGRARLTGTPTVEEHTSTYNTTRVKQVESTVCTQTSKLQPSALNPKPCTLNLNPSSLNNAPYTLNAWFSCLSHEHGGAGQLIAAQQMCTCTRTELGRTTKPCIPQPILFTKGRWG